MRIPIPFLGASYESTSKSTNSQECVNLYPEADPAQGKNALILVGTPGLELFSTLGASPIRGSRAMKGFIYAVSGNILYSVLPNGVKAEIGALQTSSGNVSMVDNGTQLMIVDGDYGYIYNTSTEVFAQITDADFPGADTVAFLDGYFVFNKPNTGSFMITGLYDGTTVDALDIKTAEGHPDNILAIHANKRFIFAFGEKTTEVYWNSGNADFPLERVQGGFMQIGLAARWSVGRLGRTLLWLSEDEHGNGRVVKSDGMSSVPISTPAIEYQIGRYGAIADAEADTYRQDGHEFYVLSFPSAGQTWVYDLTTGVWHERSSNGGRWRAKSSVHYLNTHYIGDYANGNIYKMKIDYYSENGEEIKRVRVSPPVYEKDQNIFYENLIIEFEPGVGLTTGQGSDPQAMLQWSDDRGYTWSNEHWKTIGKKGKYKNKAIFKRIGYSSDRRFRLTISDPVEVRIIAAYANVELGYA